MLTLLVAVYPRLTGVQKSNEEMRNQTQAAVEVFEKLMLAAASRRKLEDGEVISIDG